MKKYIAILAVLLAACSKPADDTRPAGTASGGGSGISFSYASPAAPATYSGPVAAAASEKIIRDMDVFMFLEDGTFVRKLAAGDFNSASDGATTTLTLTNSLIADHYGQQALFYFVANNAASTGGVHIGNFSGTEDDFRELLTKPLPESPYAHYAGKAVNITIAPETGGLLMTGKSDPVYLSGKCSQTVILKRRMARFDLYNPKAAEGIRIENFYISDARTQATLFSGSSAQHAIGVKSTEIVWGPDRTDYDAQGYCQSVFYLYPTDLATTSIAIEVKNNANTVKMFELNSSIIIEANKRYMLIFNGADLTVDGTTGDWTEGGMP